MVLRDDAGWLQPITTPLQMGMRRALILAGMSLTMGTLPDSDCRVPIDAQVVPTVPVAGYERQKISFATELGDRVPAWLLIPTGQTSPGATLLCLHQTTGIGKDEPAGLGALENLHHAHELAVRGFVCLVQDPSIRRRPL
ncbi:MAG: hypothetical protein DWI22_02030 [Planctomycetota bacterium]|nr:MAG: hypothetical protein DWI22_02030 [Planctomycetota bacterium]